MQRATHSDCFGFPTSSIFVKLNMGSRLDIMPLTHALTTTHALTHALSHTLTTTHALTTPHALTTTHHSHTHSQQPRHPPNHSTQVESNTTFGQYQNCNGYPPKCAGSNNFLVGHSGAQNQGPVPNNGQCSSNPLVGEWYSLPVGGKCTGEARPHDGTCTWRKHHIKTIDSKCLIEQHGFKEVCAKDARAPFSAVSRTFSPLLQY